MRTDEIEMVAVEYLHAELARACADNARLRRVNAVLVEALTSATSAIAAAKESEREWDAAHSEMRAGKILIAIKTLAQCDCGRIWFRFEGRALVES